jgi:hypothetical protein
LPAIPWIIGAMFVLELVIAIGQHEASQPTG